MTLTRSFYSRAAWWTAFLVLLPTAVSAAQGLSPQERRAELKAIYETLRDDPRLDEYAARMTGRLDDRALVDEYLRFLPISPLELLEMDMRAKRYEFGIPKLIAEWHARWIQLHEELARELYGDVYVDSRIADWPADTEGSALDATPPGRMPTVGPNRNVASTFTPAPEDYQGEIQVAVNPNNTNQIVAAANTWDTIGGTCAGGVQAVFYSADGGDTWGYTCPPLHTAYPSMTCAGTVFGSDPALSWNDSDEVFLNHMMICFLGGNTFRYAMVVARSADGGANWNAQGVIKNSWSTTDLEDKNFYLVDNTPTSPFYGRHYTCWDRNNNEIMAWSNTNGTTWNEVDLPTSSGNGTGNRFDLGCDLAIGADGTVHIVFNTLSCLADCNNEEMFYTRSTNGGLSWSTPIEVRDFNLVAFSNNSCPDAQDERCIGPFGGIAIDNSGGACDGTLYATFGDFTSGNGNNSDVWVSRSTNNGTSWSAPVMVNDDGLANRAQFHSFVQVDDSNGDVVVGWHDARNDPGNDAIDYFVARSTDCGVSFEANIQASQPSNEFNNSTISFSNENTADNPNRNPNQYGEYMGVDARDGKAYLAWSDTRHFFPGSPAESQAENLGFAIVEFDTGGGGTAQLEGGAVTVGSSAVTVNLVNTYVSPVVVTTMQYNDSTTPTVTRVSNVTSTSFDVRLQAPSGGGTATETVSYLVVEEGSWTIDGFQVEAQKYTSTVTDENNSWVGEAQSYLGSYTNPVVLGQVMSENDADWSVFWDQGSSRTNPPSATTLRTGKTVCEDPDTTRDPETVGFVVIEAGHGTIGGVEFEAALGADTVAGVGNAPPYSYTFNTAFAAAPTVALTTMAAVDGVNGGWAQVHGATMATTTNLFLSIDEDTLGDPERAHTTEQVGYLAFAGPVVFPATGGPQARLEWGSVSAGASAVTVNLVNTYTSPVVVTTAQYANNSIPVVTRISNVTGSSFAVRLQAAGAGTPVAENISYLVVEEGTWDVGGVQIDAQTYTSTVTDENNSWVGEAQSYGASFTNPVVLGQVMSENDADWSVFWDQGTARTNPPSASALVTGKTVCEDTFTARADETVGIVVIEAGHGTLGGVEYEAALGADSVFGVGNAPPYTYTFSTAFATAPTVAITTMAGVDGGNGGWAQVHGATLATTTSLFLSIDEDTIGDSERNHTSEQVGYIAFASAGSVQ